MSNCILNAVADYFSQYLTLFCNLQNTPCFHLTMSTGKKGKGQKMSLTDFITQSDSTESWADLPSQPISTQQSLPSQPLALQPESAPYPSQSYSSSFNTEPDYSKIKPGGPYIARVGNISYQATEKDIETFFKGLNVSSIRLLYDRESGKSRGQAFVEFMDEQSLRHALSASGTQVLDRRLKIEVADDRPGRPSHHESARQHSSVNFGEFRSGSGMITSEQHRPSRYSSGSSFHSRQEMPIRRDEFKSDETPSDWRNGPKRVVDIGSSSASIETSSSHSFSGNRGREPRRDGSEGENYRERRAVPRQAKQVPPKFSDADFVFRRKE